MRLTLTYDGTDLKSSNPHGRVKEKQTLREHFHLQLRRLWDTNNVLGHVDRQKVPEGALFKGKFDRAELVIPETSIPLEGFMYRRTIHGSRFIPLVTGRMEAHCHIAMRLGRPVGFRNIFEGGDLDKRLLTLFDSLAVPRDEQQVHSDQCTQNEYLCLLGDDSLITGLSIESYEILETAGSKQDPNYVDMNIAITITAATPMNGTYLLLFG